MVRVIEHSENTFYNTFYNLHKQIATGQDEVNSQEETETFFEHQKSKSYVKVIVITKKWSG